MYKHSFAELAVLVEQVTAARRALLTTFVFVSWAIDVNAPLLSQTDSVKKKLLLKMSELTQFLWPKCLGSECSRKLLSKACDHLWQKHCEEWWGASLAKHMFFNKCTQMKRDTDMTAALSISVLNLIVYGINLNHYSGAEGAWNRLGMERGGIENRMCNGWCSSNSCQKYQEQHLLPFHKLL